MHTTNITLYYKIMMYVIHLYNIYYTKYLYYIKYTIDIYYSMMNITYTSLHTTNLQIYTQHPLYYYSVSRYRPILA